MELIIIGFSIFIASLIIIELMKAAFRNMRSVQKSRIRKRLREFSNIDAADFTTDITRRKIYSRNKLMDKMLGKTPGMKRLEQMTVQANSPRTPGFYLLLVFLILPLGFFLSYAFSRNLPISCGVAAVFSTMPFLQLFQLKKQRLDKFRKQFPEALDLIARALRSGHAFSGGMKLAADEFGDPLGLEFQETLDEINFGVSVQDALKNLASRIDCKEVRYFVVAVILQRETGGNLAEIIESIAAIIRQQFKFSGKVRTLSAEGKLSAIILVLLPFLIVAYLKFSNPQYIELLFTEPMGRLMLLFAGTMMFIGIIVIKKMITIKY